MSGDIKLTGAKDLYQRLIAIDGDIRERIVLLAMRKAVTVVEAAVFSRVPVQRHARYRAKRRHLKNAIVHKIVSDGVGVIGLIGPQARKAPHARIVESGSRRRQTNSKPVYAKRVINGVTKRVSIGSRQKKDGKARLNRGQMPAFHYMRDGFNASSANALQIMTSTITAELAKEGQANG